MQRRRSLRRKTASKDPKAKFTVFTEGANTEPQYLRALAASSRSSLLQIEIIAAAGSPKTIRDKAIAEAKAMRSTNKRNSFESRDQVWAVFDRDEHDEVEAALSDCEAAGVKCGFSDPCFEVWLILHYCDYDRNVDRHTVQSDCIKLCDCYEKKGKKVELGSEILSLVKAAEARAEKQIAERLKIDNRPSRPFTTMYKLTQAFRRGSAP